MARYIWCPTCFVTSGGERGGHTVRLGKVRQFDVWCDRCNKPLPLNADAVAVTFHDRPEDYSPWEHEYLATLKEPERKNERPSCSPGQGDADGRSGEPAPAKVTSHDNEWKVISIYTRRQAIADGVLVDVTPTAAEAGFRVPVAVTQAVWAEYIAVPPGVVCQDEGGRLWDVLSMLAFAVRRGGLRGSSEVRYHLHVRNDNSDAEPPLVELKAVCGPDDDGSPCVTIMQPDED